MLHSLYYFFFCLLGGAVACGPTHTALMPLDLIKCRRQADPAYFSSSYFNSMKNVYKHEGGLRALFTGWAPALIGYSLLGAVKFGFYEVFKWLYGDVLAPWSRDTALLFLTASASSEILADIALCPFEGVKVRMQTEEHSKAGKGRRGWLEVWEVVRKEEGWSKGLYRGIWPLWARQIPYTMMKFAMFESTVELIYIVFGSGKASYSGLQQIGASFLAGYLTGIVCALVSHPADVMVSAMNADEIAGEPTLVAMNRIYRRIGFRGLWNGLTLRIVMIGSLTAAQWLIYNSWKIRFGLPTTGGH